MIDLGHSHAITRRQAGATLAACCGAAAIGGVAHGQQPPAPAHSFASGVSAIDIHHHYLPPFYKPLARSWLDRFATGVAGVLAWTPERSLAVMEAGRVGHAVLSISAPGAFFGDAKESRRVASACNDYAAQLAHDHPGKFSFFAALPLPDIAGAIAEADRALALPGCRGIGLLTNYDGRYLGDPMFRPLFDHLAARDVLLFVHPTTTPCCTGVVPTIPTPAIEFPVDTARTITSLLWSGWFGTHHRLRFVFCHGGGVLPMVLERIASIGLQRPELAANVPEGSQAALQRIFVDTASITTAPGMAAVQAWLLPQHILYGTDYPWGDPAHARGKLEQLGIAPERLAAIERDNAVALLKMA